MNPKLTKFIEDNPNMGLLGFAWACYWRITLVVFAIYLVAVVLIMIGTFAMIGAN